MRGRKFGHTVTKETREKIRLSLLGKPGRNTGNHHSTEAKEKMRQAKLGKKLSPSTIEKLRQRMIGNKYTLGRKTPIEEKIKISQKLKGRVFSITHRKKLSELRKGSKSPWWKGGITETNKTLRKGVKFKLWREAVFKRDNWTCQNPECNERGGELHPHHIKPFALFPKLRFKVSNGLTLCAKCHKKTDTYGWKSYHQKVIPAPSPSSLHDRGVV